jgi:hypothetical protein
MASKPVKLQRPGKGHCVQSLLADKLVLHRDLVRVPFPPPVKIGRTLYGPPPQPSHLNLLAAPVRLSRTSGLRKFSNR